MTTVESWHDGGHRVGWLCDTPWAVKCLQDVYLRMVFISITT